MKIRATGIFPFYIALLLLLCYSNLIYCFGNSKIVITADSSFVLGSWNAGAWKAKTLYYFIVCYFTTIVNLVSQVYNITLETTLSFQRYYR